jgi:hypothetical protein
MGEKLPAAEASQAFATLMHACSSLISTNERLTKALVISEGIVQDLEIEICVKDIELFNFTSQQDQKD